MPGKDLVRIKVGVSGMLNMNLIKINLSKNRL